MCSSSEPLPVTGHRCPWATRINPIICCPHILNLIPSAKPLLPFTGLGIRLWSSLGTIVRLTPPALTLASVGVHKSHMALAN